jgi:hypothetical protein
VKIRFVTMLAVGALALVAASAAQAARATDEAGDPTAIVYLTCTDGTTYQIDGSEFSPDDVAPYLCPDGYTVSDTPPDADTPDPTVSVTDTTDDGGPVLTPTDTNGGVDVGIDAPSNQSPDPTYYSTQVQCPDGTIWAVAAGDTFSCP